MDLILNGVKISKPTAAQSKSFPFSLPFYKNGLTFDFKKPVTIIAGENAVGKSTLLESLAVKCGFPKQGGFWGHVLRKTYGTDWKGDVAEREFDNLILADNMELDWNMGIKCRKGYFLRAEYMSETLSQYKRAYEYLSCSHGEGLLTIMNQQFKDGVFILDEPETALSPQSQFALLALIYQNSKQYNCQYIIVTHSPILMSIPESDFYWLDKDGFNGMDYRDCQSYKFAETFFENPDRMLRHVTD